MIRSTTRPLCFGLLAALSLCARAPAGELTDQVRQTTDKILAIVQDPASKDPNQEAERRKRIRKVIDERFDWEAMARSAMGKHWRGLTDAQRKEFIDLFSQLVEQNYLAKVENYSGEKIAYKGDKLDGKYGIVDVVVTTLTGTEVPINYRLVKGGEKWMVHDIHIEGVSLINNYRNQIGPILDSSSYDGLVKKIRARLAAGGTPEGDKDTPQKKADRRKESPP